MGCLLPDCFAANCQFAMAQEAYPVRSIRLLVGFAAGGATDVTFRKLGERPHPSNLAGRSSSRTSLAQAPPIAPSTMAKTEKPDGYVAAATADCCYPLMQKVDWDPVKDFTWIAGLGGYSFALAINAGLAIEECR